MALKADGWEFQAGSRQRRRPLSGVLPFDAAEAEERRQRAVDGNGAGEGRGGLEKGAAAVIPSRSDVVWDLASPHEVELGSGDSCPWRRGRAPLVPAEAGEGEREGLEQRRE